MRKIKPILGDPRNFKTESFKRPDHPDFWTSSECKTNKFSGVRRNTIALQWEFWILGDMVRTVSFQAVANDPFALTKAHVDIFCMVPDQSLFKR